MPKTLTIQDCPIIKLRIICQKKKIAKPIVEIFTGQYVYKYIWKIKQDNMILMTIFAESKYPTRKPLVARWRGVGSTLVAATGGPPVGQLWTSSGPTFVTMTRQKRWRSHSGPLAVNDSGMPPCVIFVACMQGILLEILKIPALF